MKDYNGITQENLGADAAKPATAATPIKTTAVATPVKTLPYWLDPKFYIGNIIAIGIAVWVGYELGKRYK